MLYSDTKELLFVLSTKGDLDNNYIFWVVVVTVVVIVVVVIVVVVVDIDVGNFFVPLSVAELAQKGCN